MRGQPKLEVHYRVENIDDTTDAIICEAFEMHAGRGGDGAMNLFWYGAGVFVMVPRRERHYGETFQKARDHLETFLREKCGGRLLCFGDHEGGQRPRTQWMRTGRRVMALTMDRSTVFPRAE